jgi:hypothetical protein
MIRKKWHEDSEEGEEGSEGGCVVVVRKEELSTLPRLR